MVDIAGLPKLLFIFREVRGQYPGVVAIYISCEGLCGGYGVACERVLEGGEVIFLKYR